MSASNPIGSGHDEGHDERHDEGRGPGTGSGDTRSFGDLQVSAGPQSAYVTIELILYVLAVVGVFVTAAIVDENAASVGFSASEAWFYVTLLTVGFMVSRGLAKIGSHNDNARIF